MTPSQKHAARLREIKHKIGYIAVHGHYRGYDWNADPMQLTLTEGEANALLDQAIAGAEALEAQGHLSANEHYARLAKHLDHSDAYFAGAAEHLVRIEAIHERIASALEMLVHLQGRQ